MAASYELNLLSAQNEQQRAKCSSIMYLRHRGSPSTARGGGRVHFFNLNAARHHPERSAALHLRSKDIHRRGGKKKRREGGADTKSSFFKQQKPDSCHVNNYREGHGEELSTGISLRGAMRQRNKGCLRKERLSPETSSKHTAKWI
ncbi:hypothetical protein OJAV_G00221350 [Oryzias javanicus]|uniref:Uncharacterized protein n=1 Tax=Oryzias javanicus TaxID=123683 RepID=A0A3S2NU10_ORYJA|nr:hypothetical protein OJAV_G00221350 [Oryzias javanicus]